MELKTIARVLGVMPNSAARIDVFPVVVTQFDVVMRSPDDPDHQIYLALLPFRRPDATASHRPGRGNRKAFQANRGSSELRLGWASIPRTPSGWFVVMQPSASR